MSGYGGWWEMCGGGGADISQAPYSLPLVVLLRCLFSKIRVESATETSRAPGLRVVHFIYYHRQLLLGWEYLINTTNIGKFRPKKYSLFETLTLDVTVMFL